jgi:signal-transduction protein with cAMP-binding, CBS, and nucleotidyltransferase domain
MKPFLYKETLQKMKLEEHAKSMATISKVPLFGCLTNKQKFAISNAIKLARFEPGESIFQKDDDVQMIYIVSEGLVKISIP